MQSGAEAATMRRWEPLKKGLVILGVCVVADGSATPAMRVKKKERVIKISV